MNKFVKTELDYKREEEHRESFGNALYDPAEHQRLRIDLRNHMHGREILQYYVDYHKYRNPDNREAGYYDDLDDSDDE